MNIVYVRSIMTPTTHTAVEDEIMFLLRFSSRNFRCVRKGEKSKYNVMVGQSPAENRLNKIFTEKTATFYK